MSQPQNPVRSFVTTLLDPSSFISKHIAEGRVINAHLEHDPMSEATKVSLWQFVEDCTKVLESAGYINVQLPELPTLLTHCVPGMRAGKDETFRLLSGSVKTLIFSEQAELLLNGLLRYILVDQYQKPIDTVVAEVETILMHVVLLEPISLNTKEEKLTVEFHNGDAPDPKFIAEYLANSEGRHRYRKAFRPHYDDSDTLDKKTLVHLHTRSTINLHRRVADKAGALHCVDNGMREHIPDSTETLGELREYMETTLKTQRAIEALAKALSRAQEL